MCCLVASLLIDDFVCFVFLDWRDIGDVCARQEGAACGRVRGLLDQVGGEHVQADDQGAQAPPRQAPAQALASDAEDGVQRHLSPPSPSQAQAAKRIRLIPSNT